MRFKVLCVQIHVYTTLAFCISPTMISKILRAIITGPPGSGKGTIAKRIVKDFGMVHFSSGDMLRSQMAHRTVAGIRAKDFINAGKLVPDEIMVELVLNEVEEMEDKNWLLDGFPRTVPQAEALFKKVPVDVVVNLDVPFDVIIDRVKNRWLHPGSGRTYNNLFNPPKVPGKDDVTGEPLVQRDDDKPETVLNRLKSYEEQTKPVLEYYRLKNLLQNFQGKESNEIWPKVHEFLSTKTTPLQYTEYK